MKSITSKIAIATLALAPFHVFAADMEPSTWSGNVELGLIITSGNTETESINAKAKAITDREKWRHTLTAEALQTSTSSDTTADKFFLAGKSDYKISKLSYFFATVNYEKDKFGGYDYQTNEAIGYGQRVIDKKSLFLELEAGLGARQSELKLGGSTDEFVVRTAGSLEWKLSDTSKFNQDLSIAFGEDSTDTKSVSSLTANIAGSLAMKISLTLNNKSDVPDGFKKTDTETAVTLVYGF